MTTESLFNRYASLIDAPESFQRSIHQPLPICVWANPLKTTPDALAAFLEQEAIAINPLNWYSGAFRSSTWRKPGQTLGFVTGWYQVQEEIALTAVTALNPQPGERILDLCAAPGGKTAQIAVRVGDSGMVVANEMYASRLASLRTTLDRLGIQNTIVTNEDGRKIALPSHSFDRILVDVPCSGEGTIRKSQGAGKQWQPSYNKRLQVIQRQLLEQALKFVKPGGVIVYSTCTFAPEENEAVIDAVLGDRGYLESAAIPGLYGLSGLQSWQGQSFRSDLVNAQRYFPHFNDTGGFFVARIRRTDVNLSPPISETYTSSYSPINNPALLAEFCDRFGINSTHFNQQQLLTSGNKTIWCATTSCSLDFPAVETIGLPLLRQTKGGIKPTTFGLQRFGRNATQNVIELQTPKAMQSFMSGETQTLNTDVERGYVHVRYGAFELGCGFYKEGQLFSKIPKVLRLLSETSFYKNKF